MISDGALRLLSDWIHLCSATWVLPLSWDAGGGRVTLSLSRKKYRYYGGRGVQILLAIYVIYYMFQYYATLHPKESSSIADTFLPFGWVTIYTSGYIWGFGNLSSYWKHQGKIAGYLNVILAMNTHLKNVFGKRVNDGVDLIKFTLLFMKLVIVGCWLTLNALHFFHPDRAQYLSSKFSNNLYLYVIFFIVDHFTVTIAATFCSLELTLLSFYIIFSSKVMSILRKSDISPSLKIDFYNQLILLNRLHRSCNDTRMHQLMYCLGIATIIGNVGIIRFHEYFSLFDFAAMVFFGHVVCILFLGILHFFGTLPFNCERFLGSLRMERNKVIQMRVRCLHVFGIECVPIKAMRFNAMFHSMAASINMIVTFLVFLE